MKSCGKRFHDEVGKFRFLNELIKVVSPKVRPGPGSDGGCRRKVSRGLPVRNPAQSLLQDLTESGQPEPLRNSQCAWRADPRAHTYCHWVCPAQAAWVFDISPFPNHLDVVSLSLSIQSHKRESVMLANGPHPGYWTLVTFWVHI